MKKTRSDSRSKSTLKSILFGILIIWGLFFVLSLLFTVILFSGQDPTGSTSLFSLISFMAAGALGTLLNKRFFKGYPTNTPLFSLFASAIIYVAISAIITGKISIGCLISAVCFILLSMLCLIKKKKKIKRRSR